MITFKAPYRCICMRRLISKYRETRHFSYMKYISRFIWFIWNHNEASSLILTCTWAKALVKWALAFLVVWPFSSSQLLTASSKPDYLSSSLEPLDQFHPNMIQSTLGPRRNKWSFLFLRGDNRDTLVQWQLSQRVTLGTKHPLPGYANSKFV